MPSDINGTPQPAPNPGGLDASAFDGLAQEYDDWFDKEGKVIFQIELKAFQEILPDLPKPWLEIGVGSGRFARALGIDTGVEPSLELAKIAHRRGINTFRGKGERRFFEKASFGTVFLITTLCFLDSPLDVLEEVHRILVPGGKIVLGMVLKDSPWGKYYEQKKNKGHRLYKFATFYSCNEVARLTVQAGFRGERILSTLFQQPGKVLNAEDPKQGYYNNAGFVIIVAKNQEEEAPPIANSGNAINEQ
jgi:SAM-dependent methyltransferase